MIDQAGIMMAQGALIASERIIGVNDNMAQSHYHEYFELYYLETGERFHMVRDRCYKMTAGEFIIFPPYVMHYSYGEKDMPFKRLVLYFRQEELGSDEIFRELCRERGICRLDTKKRTQIHRIMEQLLEEQKDPGRFTVSYRKALLNLLAAVIVRADLPPVRQEKRSRINEIISYIHSHYYEDLKLECLAQQFYISPWYLCREFKRYTNSTLVNYINVTRIMNAQRSFMETDKNVTQISQEVGFSSLTHFNRVFKAVTGTTPSEYKRQFRTYKAKTADSR